MCFWSLTHSINPWFKKRASRENQQAGDIGTRTGSPQSLHHPHCCCREPEDNPDSQDEPRGEPVALPQERHRVKSKKHKALPHASTQGPRYPPPKLGCPVGHIALRTPLGRGGKRCWCWGRQVEAEPVGGSALHWQVLLCPAWQREKKTYRRLRDGAGSHAALAASSGCKSALMERDAQPVGRGTRHYPPLLLHPACPAQARDGIRG